MFRRTKPQTLRVDLDGLRRVIVDLSETHGPIQNAWFGEVLRVRPTLDEQGFVVFLTREQTRYLTSRLPAIDLAREYGATEAAT